MLFFIKGDGGSLSLAKIFLEIPDRLFPIVATATIFRNH